MTRGSNNMLKQSFVGMMMWGNVSESRMCRTLGSGWGDLRGAMEIDSNDYSIKQQKCSGEG